MPDSITKFFCLSELSISWKAQGIYTALIREQGDASQQIQNIKNRAKRRARDLLKDELDAKDQKIKELQDKIEQLEETQQFKVEVSPK